MKNFFTFAILLAISTQISAQKLKVNEENQSNYLFKSLTKPSRELINNSLVSTINENKLNNETYDYQLKPALYIKSTFKQGALKGGASFASSPRFITSAEVLLFDSEVVNTTVNFLKNTNLPYVAIEAEYMVLDKIGVGGFLGYTQTNIANRGSDGVNKKTSTSGFILGANASYYRQINNLIYIPLFFEIAFERGNFISGDGLKNEKYIYQRIRPGVGIGVTTAVNDNVQITIRGVDVNYVQTDFVQTYKINSAGNADNLRLDQKLSRSSIQLSLNPRISVMSRLAMLGGKLKNR